MTVFQTPPEATATYQVLVREGTTAMSAIRPDVRAGPSDRSLSPEKVSAEKGAFGLSSALSASASWAERARETSSSAARSAEDGRFMG
ncbi:MAG TPA: hypothetical protein VF580_15445 [Thermoanaerobaculia bacterium]